LAEAALFLRVIIVAVPAATDATTPSDAAAWTAEMIRRSVLRSSSHFSSASSSFLCFSAAVSAAGRGGGGGGGRVGSTTGRCAAAAGDDGADSSRPMRRATMASGGGRGLSQLDLRCSGAIIGLRGVSQDRRLQTAAGCCCCVGFGFTGERNTGEGDAVSAFFFVAVEDGAGEEGCCSCLALFLAVRRFRWWLRWYGEKRRRSPAMHPMVVRLVAVEHAEDDEAHRWADNSGCCCCAGGGCILDPVVQ
jgi:hypothetical protein